MSSACSDPVFQQDGFAPLVSSMGLGGIVKPRKLYGFGLVPVAK